MSHDIGAVTNIIRFVIPIMLFFTFLKINKYSYSSIDAYRSEFGHKKCVYAKTHFVFESQRRRNDKSTVIQDFK